MSHHNISSFDQLRSYAETLAKTLSPGDTLLLIGEMGSGKTTFVSYLADVLNVVDWVNSPTFSLIHHYSANIPIDHLDLYRLDGSADVALLDMDKILSDTTTLKCIEWPDKWDGTYPGRVYEIRFSNTSQKRSITQTIR